MVNQRQFLPPAQVCFPLFQSRATNPELIMHVQTPNSALLKSRLYSARDAYPRNTPVHVRSTGPDHRYSRYPCVEGVLDDTRLQSYIHDFFIRVFVKRKPSIFRVFFKRHKNLPRNSFLDIQGDVIVMRVASRNRNSLVNLRSSDIRLLDRSLMKYV